MAGTARWVHIACSCRARELLAAVQSTYANGPSPFITGVVTVEVLEARLPPRVHPITRKEKPLHPYAAMVIGSAGTSVACVALHVMRDVLMG
jgi:hypothetical protein